MVINHEHRFIFFHVPKTAGVSVRNALLKIPGSKRRRPKHITPARYRVPWRPLRFWRGHLYFTFCFVRDPWERFGSLHRYLLKLPQLERWVPRDVDGFAAQLVNPAPEFVAAIAVRPQSDYARGVRFVGRFEQLDTDLARIATRLGFDAAQLGRHNVSGEVTCYRDSMSTRTQNIIADFYREDIARFGYR